MSKVLGAGLGVTIPSQDIYEISATQKQRLGTRLQRGDRVFRYVKTSKTLTDNELAVHPVNAHAIRNAAIPTVSYPIGSTKIKVTVDASDGEARDGVILAHELEGGHVMFYKAGANEWIVMGVLDNGLAASNLIELTLDGELPIALTHTVDYCEEAMASPYLNINHDNADGKQPFMGMAMRLLTVAEPYGWIQTWGPARIAPQDGNIGTTGDTMNVMFRHDGSLDLHSDGDNRQHAGFVLTQLAASAQAAPFIFLQISP